MITGMRKPIVNFMVFLALAFILVVGVRCIQIFLNILPVSAATSVHSIETPSPTITEYLVESALETNTPTPEVIFSTSTPTLPAPTPTPFSYGPDVFPKIINPLTGLPVDDPQLLERRPMVVKITNFPRSVRPQWGLNAADHVYEYYIGDNFTRFIGIFYGRDAERVGPVRSARLFDEHIMRMYRGVFVFAYADDLILDRLMQPELIPYLVIETRSNCPPICRLEHHGSYYNNLFVDTKALTSYINARGVDNGRQKLSGLFFSSQTPLSGQAGENLSIRFTYASYHRWEYDPQRGRYLRFQDFDNNIGEVEMDYLPLMDSMDSEQISSDNVVVMRVHHEIVYKSSSTQIDEMPIIGEGSGYAFRDGQIYPIFWDANGKKRLFSLYLPDGNEYPLKPGNVWFEIIGETSNFEAGNDGGWHIDFQMP